MTIPHGQYLFVDGIPALLSSLNLKGETTLVLSNNKK
jgi:hypothetical protein